MSTTHTAKTRKRWSVLSASLIGASMLWAGNDPTALPFGAGRLLDSFDGEASITVVSESEAVETLASVTGYADITGHEYETLDGFVDRVIAEARGRPIEALYLAGHGHSLFGQIVGGYPGELHAWVTVDDMPDSMVTLERLRPHFAPGAVVTLAGCDIAARGGAETVRALSELWGVEVRASRETQYSFHGLEGARIYVCRPDAGAVTCGDEANTDWPARYYPTEV